MIIRLRPFHFNSFSYCSNYNKICIIQCVTVIQYYYWATAKNIGTVLKRIRSRTSALFSLTFFSSPTLYIYIYSYFFYAPFFVLSLKCNSFLNLDRNICHLILFTVDCWLEFKCFYSPIRFLDNFTVWLYTTSTFLIRNPLSLFCSLASPFTLSMFPSLHVTQVFRLLPYQLLIEKKSWAFLTAGSWKISMS